MITITRGRGAFATRSLESATRTGTISWLWARRCGARDGLAGLPFIDTSGSEVGATTEFLRGRVQRYVERDEREFNAALAAVGADVEALRALADEIAEAGKARAIAAAELDMLLKKPRVIAADIVRGPAEKTTAESVLIGRRQAVFDGIAATARGELAAFDAALTELRRRYADHAYRVRLAFEHYVTRSGRARAQTERLCAEYRRQVTRHHPDSEALQRAWVAAVTVPTPTRTLAPCPWLPAQVPTVTSDALDSKEI